MQITKDLILKLQFVNYYWYFQSKLQKIKNLKKVALC